MNDAPGALVDRVHELPLAVARGGGEPEFAVTDEGGRMPKPLQVDLPSDVLAARLVPFDGHAAGVTFGRAAVLKGTVAVRPGDVGCNDGPPKEDRQENEFCGNQSE